MSDKNDVSFEVLHLIAILFKEFENLYNGCITESEEIYVLAYLHYFGIPYTYQQKPTKIIQTGKISKILKEHHFCNKNAPRAIINKLSKSNLIYEFNVELGEKRDLFVDGQTAVIGLTNEGENKLSQFTTKLEELYKGIIDSQLNLFDFPENPQKNPKKGFVIKSLLFYLKNYHRIKDFLGFRN